MTDDPYAALDEIYAKRNREEAARVAAECRRRGITVEQYKQEQRRAEQEEFRRRSDERERARPCHGITRDQVKAWMKAHAKPGLVVAIRNSMAYRGGDFDYTLDTIEEVSPRKGRIYTRYAHSYKAGNIFYYSGQSAVDPTGQVDMLIPTPALVAAALATPESRPDAALVERALQQTRELFGEEVPHEHE